LYVCDGGPFGTVVLCEEWTDRGPDPAERPLTLGVLVELAELVAALGNSGIGEGER
jgi:hypothetical protein